MATKKKTDTDTTDADEAVAENTRAEAQEAMDAEHEKGYRGVAVDPTPNENYSVSGVTEGKPTPETDPKHRRKVRDALEERAASRF